MIYIPMSLLPFLVGAAVLIGLFRLVRWAAPKIIAWGYQRTKANIMGQNAQPLGVLSRLNPLRFGQNATPATSLNTILLRTTPGMRLWAVAINICVNYYIWVYAKGQILPEGLPTIALSLSAGIACIGLFLYEARLEDDRLIIRKWGLLHREYRWRDLTAVKENSGYDYILHFKNTEVRMPKYLVGAQGFLTFLHDTIAGNHALNARTARS